MLTQPSGKEFFLYDSFTNKLSLNQLMFSFNENI